MNEEVNYLKEHLYEIYQYKKSMKDLTYDMDLKHLLRTCKALDYLQKQLNKQKEVLDKIKEKCLSIKGNSEHTIVSKNELVKQFLELLEEIE